MKPDIIISVRFMPTSEGGRETPVQGQFYSCPLFIDGEGFDCRLLLDGRCLDLGASYDVPVKFLYRDKALPKMKPGAEVHLWEGRNIAQGQVIQVFEDN
jgi:hypothetical protein